METVKQPHVVNPLPFVLTERNIHDLLHPSRGGTVVKPSPTREYLALLQQLNEEYFRASEKLIEVSQIPVPTEGLTMVYSYTCLNPNEPSIWTAVAARIAERLTEELLPTHALMEQEKGRIEFDDIYLNHYPDAELNVGPHRDTNCKNIVAALILYGSADYFLCKDKEMRRSRPLFASPGDIVLLRAEGFGNLERPFHYIKKWMRVGSKSFTQFGMRQYITPPNHVAHKQN